MDYKDLNDYEILYCIKENNEEANDLIYEKYKPLIESTAKRLSRYGQKLGLEKSDFIQEGMLALNSAISTFDEEKDIMFYTYVKTCIERKMISLIMTNNSNKHKILNDSIPFEINGDDGEHLIFGDVLEDKSSNPEELILELENEKTLYQDILNSLTDLEKQVFELKVNGFSYKEISDILGKSPKSIDNTIQRIKIKANKEHK